MRKVITVIALFSLILIFLHCNKKVQTIEIIKEVPVEKIIIDTVEIETIIEKEIPCIIDGLIFYDFDSKRIRGDQLGVLERIVSEAQRSPAATLKITGHSCKIGPEIYNYGLGLGRGQGVYGWLYKRIQNPMIIVSEGENEPMSHSNKKLNRRVEIKGI